MSNDQSGQQSGNTLTGATNLIKIDVLAKAFQEDTFTAP